MKKIKIGNDFKIPAEYENTEFVNIIDIGGYKIIIDDERGVLIQGISLINLFELPIGYISIIPLDFEMQDKIFDFNFIKEEHRLIFCVSFCGLGWYFKDKSDAFALMDIIVSSKENALHSKFLDKAKKGE